MRSEPVEPRDGDPGLAEAMRQNPPDRIGMQRGVANPFLC
jgi:hypothetical protein